MEDWEKELYEDDSPSVEFAGVIVILSIVWAALICALLLWVWVWW